MKTINSKETILTMQKLKIYLDISVINHLQQEDVPEKIKETRELCEQFKQREDVEIVISDMVIKKIWQCKKPKYSFMLESLAQIDYTFIHVKNAEKKSCQYLPLLQLGFWNYVQKLLMKNLNLQHIHILDCTKNFVNLDNENSLVVTIKGKPIIGTSTTS